MFTRKRVCKALVFLLLFSFLSGLPVLVQAKPEESKFVPLTQEEIKDHPTTPESTEEQYPLEEEYQKILDAKPEKTSYPFTLNTFNAAKERVEFEVKKAPEKVWVQNQNNIEVMLALGLEDRIVGACGMDDKIDEKYEKAFAKLNYFDRRPTREDVLQLEPDFILGWYSTFDEKYIGDVDFYHKRGIGTYMSLNSACRGRFPQSIYHECVDILTIGKIFDVQEKARELVDEILEEKEKINEYLKDKERKTVAVLEDEGGTYRVYSEQTLGGNIAINGGSNLVVGKGAYRGNISAEDLILANPEAIFMVWYDGYELDGKEIKGEDLSKIITENPKFASLQAVKNNQVFAVNLTGIYCSGLHTLDGILAFSKNLYPELYEEK